MKRLLTVYCWSFRRDRGCHGMRIESREDPGFVRVAVAVQGPHLQSGRPKLERVTNRANELHGRLKKLAEDDSAQMTVGLILFLPALFFLEGGDGPEAAEYARLKGERATLVKIAVEKDCGRDVLPTLRETSDQKESGTSSGVGGGKPHRESVERRDEMFIFPQAPNECRILGVPPAKATSSSFDDPPPEWLVRPDDDLLASLLQRVCRFELLDEFACPVELSEMTQVCRFLQYLTPRGHGGFPDTVRFPIRC